MRTTLPQFRLSQLFASLLALSLLATLPATLGEAEAVTEPTEECSIVHPVADYVYEQGERQVFTVNCMTPDQLYDAELEIKNAVTGLIERELPSTAPAPSGFDSSAVLLPVDDQTVGELDPGLYDLVASFPDGTTQTVRFGIASLIDFPSATCADGPALFDGKLLGLRNGRDDTEYSGIQYLRVRSLQPDPSTTWICLRQEEGDSGPGGRLEFLLAEGSSPIDVVTTAEPCAEGDDGVVPRPLWNGHVNLDPDVPQGYVEWAIDLRRGDNTLAVCLEVYSGALGTFAGAVTVNGLASADIQEIRLIPDSGFQSSRTEFPLDPSLPSSQCWEEIRIRSEPGDAHDYTLRWLEAEILDVFVRLDDRNLYGWAGTLPIAVCWRMETGSASSGGVVFAQHGDDNWFDPHWSTSPPVAGGPDSPCSLNPFSTTVGGATFEVHRSGSGDDAALCLRAAGFGVDIGFDGEPDPDVSWELDPE